MSVRNNSQRLGTVEPAEHDTPPEKAPLENPLNFMVPTEFVDLPSKGRYYPPGHPLHEKDSIEIKFMTAKEEDILTSRSLLKKGVALDRMLNNIIVDKRIKVEDLLIGDKNAVIIAARASAYGQEYTTKVTCPVCVETSQYSFNLEERRCVNQDPDDIKIDGVTKTENNTFVISLPKCNVQVEVKMLTGHEEKRIVEAVKKRSKKSDDILMTDQIRQYVVSVNGVVDRLTIDSFINSMPAADSRFLRNTYMEIVPNVDMKQNYICPSCDYEQEMEVPLTADFFWPK